MLEQAHEVADTDTTQLLNQAANGDQHAVNRLLAKHRDRLRRMVAVRMDARLAPRLDPSDVVQEALAEASRKLPMYLKDQPIPFYPWLRQIASERLIQQYRRHLGAQARSVSREQGGRSRPARSRRRSARGLSFEQRHQPQHARHSQ